jgi:hypothetical protein
MDERCIPAAQSPKRRNRGMEDGRCATRGALVLEIHESKGSSHSQCARCSVRAEASAVCRHSLSAWLALTGRPTTTPHPTARHRRSVVVPAAGKMHIGRHNSPLGGRPSGFQNAPRDSQCVCMMCCNNRPPPPTWHTQLRKHQGPWSAVIYNIRRAIQPYIKEAFIDGHETLDALRSCKTQQQPQLPLPSSPCRSHDGPPRVLQAPNIPYWE